MNKAVLFNFIVEKENKKLRVERSFQAPLDLVWVAWTEPGILDQWWAPKPWRAETKSMNFVEGGQWHYCMVGPEGERQWCLFEYEEIEKEKGFSGSDAFCDEQARPDDSKPRVFWRNTFQPMGEDTVVHIELLFNELADLETILEMGFQEGFAMGLENLDQYISAQFYLRKQKKPDQKARVSTYVNFPGKTEEAFRFYQSVFKTEFVNGIQRFDEIPADPSQPPLSEEVKRMVLHVELPLLGGHVLMGTDAPKEMGFNVVQGNNVYINLEPDSREEAERIFVGLSEGGKIEMPLQDMFWGAYYGSFTDKFGVNWMVNYQKRA